MVFVRKHAKTKVSCNIMLSACDKGGQLQVRHSLLRSMEDAQQAPSLITLNTLPDPKKPLPKGSQVKSG